tara:strand:- start:184 stop:597 length:414 start_codon:yes stop_codon:yes gene_type:complete
MIKQTVIAIGLSLGATTAAFGQEPIIQDHYKTIIDQKPYHVEVCSNVTTSGDKSGDMLKGAIIGGIIGNNVGNIENGGTLGAVIGGMLGHNNSNATGGTRRQCRTEIRYNEEQRTVYSHSTIKFITEGRTYTLKFKK